MSNFTIPQKQIIPPIIHYCWFGGNPLSQTAIRCIDSWRKYFPDYEIKEWNEQNFDVNLFSYTQEAYKMGMYAFVSDVARFWILYKYGGLYFDTDVEVIRSFEDIVQERAFMGWETADKNGLQYINPGIGIGGMPQNKIFREILKKFESLSFYKKRGVYNSYTMVPLVTDLLIQKGLLRNGKKQNVQGITIYPSEYFCPMNSITGKITLTPQTHSIHRFTMSWVKGFDRTRIGMMRFLRRCMYAITEFILKR